MQPIARLVQAENDGSVATELLVFPGLVVSLEFHHGVMIGQHKCLSEDQLYTVLEALPYIASFVRLVSAH